jgi:hypothetical protein
MKLDSASHLDIHIRFLAIQPPDAHYGGNRNQTLMVILLITESRREPNCMLGGS